MREFFEKDKKDDDRIEKLEQSLTANYLHDDLPSPMDDASQIKQELSKIEEVVNYRTKNSSCSAHRLEKLLDPLLSYKKKLQQKLKELQNPLDKKTESKTPGLSG